MHTIPLIEAVGAFDLFVGGSKGESLYAQILIAPTVVQSHPLAASGLARIPFARTQIVCGETRAISFHCPANRPSDVGCRFRVRVPLTSPTSWHYRDPGQTATRVATVAIGSS